ncbi:hypothetical protein V6N11_084133 [Hibiscus sabdariffa]|uniref:Uncharacterized protein n=1 Tax=Hibiscus sabdariffa TaxID=183260 RepID=A0ABR2QDG9_9ROSI
MGGKEADIFNLVSSEANNIALSMCFASKSIKELDTMENEDDMSILAPTVSNENLCGAIETGDSTKQYLSWQNEGKRKVRRAIC